jgi:DNA primase
MNPWHDIKSRLSVEDVIAKYIEIKSKGSVFCSVCPFHMEKTPSLIISPEKQIWHCFGCGAGGDIFGFVSMIENISKKEALELLAKEADVNLHSYNSNYSKSSIDNITTSNKLNTDEYDNGMKVLDWVSNVYNQMLLKLLENSESEIAKYCQERGINKQLIKKFKLGYAPKSHIISKLTKDNTKMLDLMLKLGLVTS